VKRALLLTLLLVLAGCGGDDGDNGGGEAQESDCVTQGSAELPELEEGATYQLAFKTNQGNFTIELDRDKAPCTSASFVGLTEKKFFNGLKFHRIVPGFVIQGGDPEGNGTGGPGYSTVDEPPDEDGLYKKGVVAMAKTLSDPRGTAGSQFFIVTADDAGLPPDYAVLGKVVEGLDVVEKIGKLGGPDEQPTEDVTIESVQVQKS
jgi:cyclophilin family peptidyl-prolyl cis-trans isomerase